MWQEAEQHVARLVDQHVKAGIPSGLSRLVLHGRPRISCLVLLAR